MTTYDSDFYSDMIQRKEGTAMKTITFGDEEYELTKVFFTWRDEQTVQEGILLHAMSDKFHDGDAIYANGWSIDIVNDESDMESMLTSGDGTTYFHKNFDGTYHLDD